jgi:hypothetical protein
MSEYVEVNGLKEYLKDIVTILGELTIEVKRLAELRRMEINPTEEELIERSKMAIKSGNIIQQGLMDGTIPLTDQE